MKVVADRCAPDRVPGRAGGGGDRSDLVDPVQLGRADADQAAEPLGQQLAPLLTRRRRDDRVLAGVVEGLAFVLLVAVPAGGEAAAHQEHRRLAERRAGVGQLDAPEPPGGDVENAGQGADGRTAVGQHRRAARGQAGVDECGRLRTERRVGGADQGDRHAALGESVEQRPLPLGGAVLRARKDHVSRGDGVVQLERVAAGDAAHHHQAGGAVLELADESLLVAERPYPAARAGALGGPRGRGRDRRKLLLQAREPGLHGVEVLFGK